MFKKIILASGLATILLAASGASFAADQERDQLRDQDKLQTQDQMYGKDLMTNQEQAEYRERIQAAKSAQERERIRNEHHEQMNARAKERGLKIPDETPVMNHRQDGTGNSMGHDSKCGGGMGGGKR